MSTAAMEFAQKEILAEDGGASLAAYREWQRQRAELLEQGARPQFQVFLASQAIDSPPATSSA